MAANGQWRTGQYTSFAGGTQLASPGVSVNADQRGSVPAWSNPTRQVKQTAPAVQVLRYVNTDAGSNGTGTQGSPYSTLANGFTDMVGTDWSGTRQQPTIMCSGATADGQASITAAWRLSSDCYLEVIGDQTNALQYDTTKYRIEVSTTGTIHAFLLTDLYLRVSRAGLKSTIVAGAGGVSIVNIAAAGDVRLDRVHVVGVVDNGRTSNCTGIRMATSAGGVARITNTLVRGMSGTGATHTGYLLDQAVGDVVAYNCTSVGNDQGFTGATTVVLKNSGTSGATQPYVGTFNAASAYNASNTAQNPPGLPARVSVTPTFADAAGGNYHLVGTDTAWRDQGTVLSSDALFPITTDGDGETRAGTWDIGADEFFAPVAGAYIALQALQTSSNW